MTPSPERLAGEITQHWAVTVERNGEQIVTIESNCLSGREISAADEETIRTAAMHLLSFIGDPFSSLRSHTERDIREGALESAARICDMFANIRSPLGPKYEQGMRDAGHDSSVAIRALQSPPQERSGEK